MSNVKDCDCCGEHDASFQTHDDGFMEKINDPNNHNYKICERCFIEHIENGNIGYSNVDKNFLNLEWRYLRNIDIDFMIEELKLTLNEVNIDVPAQKETFYVILEYSTDDDLDINDLEDCDLDNLVDAYFDLENDEERLINLLKNKLDIHTDSIKVKYNNSREYLLQNELLNRVFSEHDLSCWGRSGP